MTSPLEPSQSPRETLATPLVRLAGVTPPRAELFERLGLIALRDLLFYFPRDYHDLTNVRDLTDLEEGLLVSVQGLVEDIDARRLKRGGSMVSILIRQNGQYLRGTWFNQPFMRGRFEFGQRVMLSGKVQFRAGRWEMSHPRVQWLADDEDDVVGRVLPVYGLTEGLKQRHVRHAMRIALERGGNLVDEVFPPEFLALHRLAPIRQALPQVHFPDSLQALHEARRRFVYQELFVLQLALAVRRRQAREQARSPALLSSPKIDARIRRLLPFELTAGQEQAVRELMADVAHTYPMNRLLQGDVGSGKTIVAVFALLLAVANGYQAALMAPTEILARQHAATLDRLLEHSQVRRALLTGALNSGDRADLLRRLAAGAIDLVVGTQAMIEESVRFARLGLVIIDEQHKFGVRQRAVLKGGKLVAPDPAAAQAPSDDRSQILLETPGDQPRATQGQLERDHHSPLQAALFPTEPESSGPAIEPHYLVMTATPIPRTLTMTLFGDLDVSTLRDSPPGRQKINTYVESAAKKPSWFEFVRKKLDQGRQAYVVAPLVEESNEIDAANVQTLFDDLRAGALRGYRLGLLHGRLSSREKDDQMRAFRRRELDVLVTTTVIEVGVDVPNATLMTIEGGERFGLSQLHQLRGRIGRGDFPGFCCVFADLENEDVAKRLAAFARTTDGFALAEEDFILRGPGDLFGTKQHGLPPLRIADLVRDGDVLDEARRDALELVETDPGLAKPEHARLRRMMLVRYGKVLNLGDVG